MFGALGSIEFIAILVFFIGFFGAITAKDVVRSIIYLGIMETAVIIFFVAFGYRVGIVPPIGENLEFGPYMADPLPQALMITAIVIGMGATAVNITMLITLCRRYKTTVWDELRRKSNNEPDKQHLGPSAVNINSGKMK